MQTYEWLHLRTPPVATEAQRNAFALKLADDADAAADRWMGRDEDQVRYLRAEAARLRSGAA